MGIIKQQKKELEVIVRGGKKLGFILNRLLDEVKVGITPLSIDSLADKLIHEAGGMPSFLTVGNYQWSTCISVNEGVVHGIPTQSQFKAGDVVSIDIGMLYSGYHTDTSWTMYLPSNDTVRNRRVEQFLKIGEETLMKAISKVAQGNRIGDISQMIQETVEGAGYNVVRSLVGHGIGKLLHEAPQIPGIVTKPIGKTPLLKNGMVLAIEVIYTMGKGEIVNKNEDGWTLVTKDGSLAGLFEHTVAVTKKGPLVLTNS